MVTFTYNSTILFTNIMHDGRLRIPAKNRRRISPSEFFFYHFFFKVSFLQHEASFPSQGTTSSSLIFTARSDLSNAVSELFYGRGLLWHERFVNLNLMPNMTWYITVIWNWESHLEITRKWSKIKNYSKILEINFLIQLYDGKSFESFHFGYLKLAIFRMKFLRIDHCVLERRRVMKIKSIAVRLPQCNGKFWQLDLNFQNFVFQIEIILAS